MIHYRDNGAIGALLDEYEKAIKELLVVLDNISSEELTTIVDHETKDRDCRSIQTILSHVVKAGTNYVLEVRKSLNEKVEKVENVSFESIKEYKEAILNMFQLNVRLFDEYPDIELEQQEDSKKILVSWGQKYDVEQIFEHAIVHVLRHRRQIERFLIKLRN